MLTSISVTIENDYINGGVRIKSDSNINEIGDIASVVISRRPVLSSVWTDVYVIEVDSAEDLSFDLLDILTLSGTAYNYNIDLMPAGSIIPLESEVFYDIKFKFEGLFVGNFERFYVAGTNFRTETKQNMQVEYVTTLAGKYPYRVCNSDTNYATGTSSGLFLRLTDDKRSFVPDDNHEYSNEVLEFLCDGTSKILKTHDGQMWNVSIDANPNKVYSDYTGMNALQFSWTEIDSVPTSGMIRMAGE